MKLSWIALGAAVSAFATAAQANDTTAHLGAGGLVFVRNYDVEMKSEDLFVSPERIEVKYVFHNKSGEDQKNLVAFPLPDIKGEPYANMSIPDGPADNIFNFKTTFDGKPVATTLHQYVFVNNIEYSGELKKLGIPLSPHSQETHKALLALPEADKQHLADLGLVSRDEFKIGNGAEMDVLPVWTLRSAYSWEANFPAGRDAVVVHSYQPSVGSTVAATFVTTSDDPIVNAGTKESYDEYLAKYCVDANLMATLTKSIVRQEGYGYVPYAEQWISYIWSTAGNWDGPIGRFTLTVDKGDAKNLVSFCGENVKKIGPTTFQYSVNGWIPDANRELEVLLLVPTATP